MATSPESKLLILLSLTDAVQESEPIEIEGGGFLLPYALPPDRYIYIITPVLCFGEAYAFV